MKDLWRLRKRKIPEKKQNFQVRWYIKLLYPKSFHPPSSKTITEVKKNHLVSATLINEDRTTRLL